MSKKKKSSNIDAYEDKCIWLKHDETLLTNLFRSEYAKSVSDSFIISFYVNNYKEKIKAEGDTKDSISILKIRMVPHIVATPRGDTDVYDLTYAFTNENCSEYYDSVIKSKASIIYGLRFSISERRVICYLSTDRTLLIDSNFMNIKEKIKEPGFNNEIENNKGEINDKLKALFK